MTNLEFFAASWNNETKALRRVIEAIPADQLNYRPHERSRTAGELAWTIASEANDIPNILEHGDIDAKGAPTPSSKEEILKHLDAGIAAVSARLPQTTEERWNAMGKFIIMGNVVGTMPSSALAWLLHNDLIHHRGQLSAYLRPMGGKVPSIYGPSGDDDGSGH